MMVNAKQIHPKTILAVASGGGHWLQMMRLKPAFDGHPVAYVSINSENAADVAPARYFTVRDATRWTKGALFIQLVTLAWIVLRVRPKIVISTGAAPGYFAIRLGKLIGARTIWIDSIANADALSLSAQLARRFSDLWLTQWPEVAVTSGARYEGRLL